MATTKSETNTQSREQVVKPPLYHVVMLNDDYTPMDFVVEVLMTFFGHDEETAHSLMMRIHTQNRAVCGTYTRDIAETKAYLVTQKARKEEHPLRCVIEAAL